MKRFITLLLVILPTFAVAQDGILAGEGISGDVDKHHRSPLISVGTDVSNPAVSRILVDAVVKDEVYTKYPIRFDFFVNRKLFSSQYRSPELPGPIGIEVPTSDTPLPFNYAVVATVLHPNRQFTSVIQGAVFAVSLSSVLDCTLTVAATETGEADTVYTASGVKTTQSGSTGVDMTFTATTDDQTSSVDVKATATFGASGDDVRDATGTIVVTKDGTPTTSNAAGQVTLADSKLSSLQLGTEGDGTTLECS